MRILFVFRLPVGGLFRHVKDLLKGFHDRGHQVGVVCDASSYMPANDEVYLHQFAQLGVWRLPISRLPSFADLLVARRISLLVAQHGFDILHGHGAKGGLYARVVVKLQKRKINPKAIYTLHGGSLHYHPKSLAGFFYLSTERYLLPYTAGLIFESEFSRRRFVEVISPPSCPVKVIHHGVHESEFEIVTHISNAADFVFLGELRKLKGVDILLRAICLLQKQGYPTSLAIFGAGPDEKSFRILAAKLGARNVEWLGVAANAKDALKYGRCLVLPSLSESFSYVVLESAAMGVPVIATQVGAVSEILGRRDNWVARGDEVDLANKMRMFLDGHKCSIGNVGQIQRRVRSLFRLDCMVDSTLGFYQECLASN
jgi:glycosyltransferase involved in cell wall biosynthesis